MPTSLYEFTEGVITHLIPVLLFDGHQSPLWFLYFTLSGSPPAADCITVTSVPARKDYSFIDRCWGGLPQPASSLLSATPRGMVVSAGAIQEVNIPHADREISVNPCSLEVVLPGSTGKMLPGWQTMEPLQATFRNIGGTKA